MKPRWYCFAATLGLLSVAGSHGQVLPPPNDDYTNRIVLTGSDISVTGSLAGATFEEDKGEVMPPVLNEWPPVRQTVWWEWTPAESTTAIVQITACSTKASGRDGLEVWTITYPDGNGLFEGQPIAGFPIDSAWPYWFFSFAAKAGTSYEFQLAGSDSATVSFRLIATNLPCIIVQPRSQTISADDSVLFTVLATGQKPFGYQWQFNGATLAGETAAMLALDHVLTNQAGAYRVWVTNSGGGTPSAAADLAVMPTDTVSALSAIPAPAANQFAFSLLGEVGRRYRISSSTNLSDWSAESSFASFFEDFNSGSYQRSVVFDATGADTFTVPLVGPQKFLRAAAFHAANETCNNNIKQIRFAQILFAYEVNDPHASVSYTGLFPYLKGAQFPQCPSNGTYEVFDVSIDPQCLTGFHPFEEP